MELLKQSSWFGGLDKFFITALPNLRDFMEAQLLKNVDEPVPDHMLIPPWYCSTQ
jgi:hypothetical protein